MKAILLIIRRDSCLGRCVCFYLAVLRGGFFDARGGAMTLTKPPQVENDEFKSAKWDDLATGFGVVSV